MARDMRVKKNIHIENWASYRENCEHYFKFSRANWARFAVFGIAVPVLCYMAITDEFKREGQGSNVGPFVNGYKRRFLFDGSKDEE